MAMKILDVSKYQPTIDYAACAKDIDGVILRCGLTYWGAQNKAADECFEKHYAGFKAAGVPVGVYYYSAADSVEQAIAEADKCLAIINGKQFELPIYYDVENNERQGKLGKEKLTAIVEAFCDRVEKRGYFVGYYSYTAWLQSKFDLAKLSKYTLWKADYRVLYDKKIACDMHQYTSSGKVAGINGRVDLSHCYKDFPSIIKKAGLNGFSKSAVAQPVTKPVETVESLKVGDTVKVLKAVQYDNGKAFRCWFSTYTVKQIKGNRVVIAKAGVTVAAVHKDNLQKV